MRAWVDGLAQDIRYAFRTMRRFPIATLVAVLSLAAGIGATASALGIRNAIFRNPPPLYREPGELTRLRIGGGGRVPAALYEHWRGTLGATAGAATASGTQSDIRIGNRTATIAVRGVTSGLFSLLGVNAELGSTTLGERATDADALSAVLSYGAWEQLFDKRTDVIGQTIWIDNQPHTVVAVMPQRFWLTDMNSPVWKPLDLRALAPDDPLDVIVRRPSGLSAAALEAQLRTGLDAYAASLPPDRRQLRLRVAGIGGTPMGDAVGLVLPYLLGVCVLLTLLIACANTAILMIAQWTTREHEIAIRASIGAGRGRIVRSLLTESVIVAACGGALGLGALYAIRGWMILRGLGDGRFFDLSIQPSVVIQVVAVTLSAGLLSGIMPALFETRRLQANPLRAMAGADRARQRWRNALVVLEVAVTIALLVVTSAMIDGYRRVLTADLGFILRPLIGASVRQGDGINIDNVLGRLEEIPGVASVAASTAVPYVSPSTSVRVASDARGSNGIGARQSAIDAEFFTTLGVRLRSGRPFTPQDAAAARVVIVNDALGTRLFGNNAAVGQTLWIGETSYDIVGVVADYTTNMFGMEHAGPEVFLPLARDANHTAMSFLIRTDGNTGQTTELVRRALQAAGGIEVRRVSALAQIRLVGAQEILVGTAPLIPLITIGLLLTAAGIYGVLAFAITRRAKEFAVRLAIGATNRHVIALVGTQAMRLVGVGAIIGVGLTFALSRVVRASGGAGTIYDPPLLAFVVPAVILVATGIVAAWIPSRRALKINPAVVLRTT